MSKRVLITGINGFAGQHLATYLSEHGYEVYGVTPGFPALKSGFSCKVFQADLRNLDEVRGVVCEVKPTHVVHLAAISFIGYDKINEIYDTNIMGSRNLLQALSESSLLPNRVLLVSSANVYGSSKEGAYSETDEPNPVNDYAVSKIAMEYMSRQFSNLFNVVIVRPFNYTGRGQSEAFLIPKIVKHFRSKNDYIELGNIDVYRDFSDVRMVVQYLERILHVDAVDSVYNICTGTPTSIKQILEMCKDLTGHDIGIKVSSSLIRANEIKVLTGSPDRLHRDFGILDDYKIKDTLGWMLS